MAWLIPTISLQTELQREQDRRVAARSSRADLQILVDDLIVQWYQQQGIIDRALGRIRQLEVELALCDAPPSNAQPSALHLKMARELLDEYQEGAADLGLP